jgi:hypothetical protein
MNLVAELPATSAHADFAFVIGEATLGQAIR